MLDDPVTPRLRVVDGRETAPFAPTSDLFLAASGEPMPFFTAATCGRSSRVCRSCDGALQLTTENG